MCLAFPRQWCFVGVLSYEAYRVWAPAIKTRGILHLCYARSRLVCYLKQCCSGPTLIASVFVLQKKSSPNKKGDPGASFMLKVKIMSRKLRCASIINKRVGRSATTADRQTPLVLIPFSHRNTETPGSARTLSATPPSRWSLVTSTLCSKCIIGCFHG